MRQLFFVMLLCLSSNLFYAQEKSNPFTGSLTLDSRIAFDETYTPGGAAFQNTDPKSPLLAGLYSFILPGAGQYHNDEIWKSVIFLAAEAAAISVGIIYDGKGDDQTVLFQNYANENWSASRYAKWTITNATKINPNITDEEISVFQSKLFDANQNLNWSVLNELETQIGKYYSHRLAPYGDQQYYEMIGKYSQFNVGWVEFGEDPSKPFTYGDPLVPQFTYYAGERGKANDYYNIAKTAVIVVLVNHIVSTIEAAWTASRINKNLELTLGLEKNNYGYNYTLDPKLNIAIRF